MAQECTRRLLRRPKLVDELILYQMDNVRYTKNKRAARQNRPSSD